MKIIKHIEEVINQSSFRSMAGFSRFLGYSARNKAGLKQRIKRNIDFLNETLKHVGLEVCFKEVDKKVKQ